MEGTAQPLTIGQILDRTYRLFRANLKSFIAISMLPSIALGFIVLMLVGTMVLTLRPDHRHVQPMSSQGIVVAAAVYIVSMVGMAVVFAVFQPAVCHAALMGDLGIQTSPREAVTAAWSKLGRNIWLILLKWLIVAGPMHGALLLLGLGALLAANVGGYQFYAVFAFAIPLLMLVYLGGTVYMVFMMIRLAMATPACVAEDLPAMAAIKRSMQLSRDAKGRIFVVALVIYAINYAAMMAFEVVFALIAAVGALLFGTMHPSQGSQISGIAVIGFIFLCGFLLLMGATWSAFAAAFVIVYRDQRLRIDPPATPLVTA